jgi:putative cell wall-binding protein
MQRASTDRPGRVGVIAAVAGLVAAVALVPLATGAGAVANVQFDRFAGEDRYDTARRIAAGTFLTAETVVLATGEKFPDALAGNYRAGVSNAPILLTRFDFVPAFTKQALAELKTKNVIILGGVEAVSAAVENELEATASTSPAGGNLNVTRMFGGDRYETARVIAVTSAATPTVGTVNGRRTAIVATGDKFADALTGGPASFSARLPIVLTPGHPSTTLHPEAKAALDALDIEQAIILGGEFAITSATENEIKNANGPNSITTVRLQGAERTETARAVAEYTLANLGFTSAHVNLARGDEFPDALAGGPHAGRERSPILLTASATALAETPGTGADRYLTEHACTISGGHIYGGTDAISPDVEADAEAAAAACQAGASGVTTAPELIGAEFLRTNTNNAGTPGVPADDFQEAVIRFVFDELVTLTAQANPGAGTASLFHLVDFDGTRFDGRLAQSEADVPGSVLVTFGTSTQEVGATEVATVSVATVDELAVTDQQGLTNPIGDAALGTGTGTTAPAAVAAAPDLLSVADIRISTAPAPATPTVTADFTFDEPAFSTAPTPDVTQAAGYHLVDVDARDIPCTLTAGSGSETHAVVCQAPPGTTTVAQLARGYVDQGTVSDALGPTGALNPLQAAEINLGGSTATPDLVSAALVSPATATVQVQYVFDEDVGVPNAAAFCVYGPSGASSVVCATNAARTAARTVVATFGALGQQPVGANVEEGAVRSTASGRPNQEDEVGIATTLTSGRTDGPDLIAVRIEVRATDPFTGEPTEYDVVYVFDEALTGGVLTTANANRFRLWRADGTPFTCAAATAAAGTEAGTGAVRCSAFEAEAAPTLIGSGVLGTVDDNAVIAGDAGPSNPEGAEPTTGGTGTPAR